MSTSGSLSTLLIQRLETALGVTLSAQGHLQAARSQQGILPAGQASRIEATEDLNKAQTQGGSFQAVAKALQANPLMQARPASQATGASALPPHGSSPTPAATPPESTSTRWSSAARQLTQWLEHLPAQSPALRNQANAPVIPQAPRALLSYLGQGQERQAATTSAAAGNLAAGAPIPRSEVMNALGSSLFSSIIRQVLVREINQAGLSYEATLWQTLKSNGNLAALAQHPKAILLKQQQSAPAPAILAAASNPEGQQGGSSMPALTGALANLVRQQLEAHQQQNITWQGEAWHGAPMTWEIQKDNPSALPLSMPEETPEQQENAAQPETGSQAAIADNPDSWSSTLTLDLPHLGKIRIQLQIINQHIQAQYVVLDNPRLKDSQSTAALLLGRLPELKERLAALGMQPHGFEVFTQPSQSQPPKVSPDAS